MSFASDKAALLNTLKVRNCNLAKRLDLQIASYQDMLLRFNERHKEFDCDPTFLNTICAAMDDAALVAMGVHYNKTASLTNPKIVVGGTTTITINSGGVVPFLYIAGNAAVTLLTITGNTHVRYLEVLGNSTVTKIDVVQGSRIGELQVSKCDANASKVVKVSAQSLIEDISVDDVETGFEGIECPTFTGTTTCNEEVSNVVITFLDQNMMIVTWTNPANSVQRKLSWRKKGDIAWNGTFPALATQSAVGYMRNFTEIEVWIQNKCSASSDFSAGVFTSGVSNDLLNPAP